MTMDLKLEFAQVGFLKLEEFLTVDETNSINTAIDELDQEQLEERYETEHGCTIYGIHSSSFSSCRDVFRSLSVSQRTLGLAQELLGNDELYMYNSKLNCKRRFYGANMHWHQDMFYWNLDGVLSDELLTFMFITRDICEVDGPLYVIPGSHKSGLVKHSWIQVGSHKQYAIAPDALTEAFEDSQAAVPLIGKAGTAFVFNSTIMHGSSNNLGVRDRWQLYFSYNGSDNFPTKLSNARPNFVVSKEASPLSIVGE